MNHHTYTLNGPVRGAHAEQTSSKKFKAQPEWYDFNDLDDARTVDAEDAQHAAENYVAMNFANFDYPTEVEVIVKDQSGIVTKWNVHVEFKPVFRATKISAVD